MSTTPKQPAPETPSAKPVQSTDSPRRKSRLPIAAKPSAKRAGKPSTPKAEVSPSPPAKRIKAAASPAQPSASRTRPPAPSKGAKRPSALDAAAQILAALPKAEANSGITAPDLIARMAKAKLWTSPGGKTPASTLYAAMVREITGKGQASRFIRIGPGRFAAAHAPQTKTSSRSSSRGSNA